jgi:filamentous hemagglutinin family protein
MGKQMKYLFIAAVCWTLSVFANPLSPCIVAGEVHCEGGEGVMRVISQDDLAIIDWDTFSLSPGDVLFFLQPAKQSAILNRVVGDSPSALFGLLQSNGEIYLVNPNGIIIGDEAVVNTHSFVGTTFHILDQPFIEGRDLYFHSTSSAAVLNAGVIFADEGDAMLVGETVENYGLILAPYGKVSIIGAPAEFAPLREESPFQLIH